MTIDEAIKHCREVAEKKEKLANTYESFQDYGNSKSSLTSGREKCLKCAEEHKQLATWLEELKALKEQANSDCIRRADANLTDFEILMCDGDYKEALKMLLDKIKKAPSVNPQLKTEGARGDIPLQQTIPKMPQPKRGRWIEVIDKIDSFGNKTWHHKCSICGNADSGWGQYKYCPECGAKMESEGKQ